MKTGLKISNSGLADIILSRGVTVSFHVQFLLWACAHVGVTGHHTSHLVRPGSKHNMFYKTFKPLTTSMQVIKGSITGIEYVGRQLVSIRDHMVNMKATKGMSHSKVLRNGPCVWTIIDHSFMYIFDLSISYIFLSMAAATVCAK
jgi:hypothetical protein